MWYFIQYVQYLQPILFCGTVMKPFIIQTAIYNFFQKYVHHEMFLFSGQILFIYCIILFFSVHNFVSFLRYTVQSILTKFTLSFPTCQTDAVII